MTVSFLFSQGHRHADKYPIGYARNEAKFARMRVNAVIGTEAVVMRQTIMTALAGGDGLKEILESLNGP